MIAPAATSMPPVTSSGNRLRPVTAKVRGAVAVVPDAGDPPVTGGIVGVEDVGAPVKLIPPRPPPDWLAAVTDPFELDGSKKLDPPPPPAPDAREVLLCPPPPPPPKNPPPPPPPADSEPLGLPEPPVPPRLFPVVVPGLLAGGRQSPAVPLDACRPPPPPGPADVPHPAPPPPPVEPPPAPPAPAAPTPVLAAPPPPPPPPPPIARTVAPRRMSDAPPPPPLAVNPIFPGPPLA